MKYCILFILTFFISFASQPQEGFGSITSLEAIPVSTTTGEKPQSKIWTHAGKHWAVLPNYSGTWLWRLDGKAWTDVQKLSSNPDSKADIKVVGNLAYVLLVEKDNADLITMNFDKSSDTYKVEMKTDNIPLDDRVETATIDIDGNGRMWLAFNGDEDDLNYEGHKTFSIFVSYSDPPYGKWSTRQTIATNIKEDDIGAVIALPGRIAVLWSNQSAERFGFKTHLDKDDPASWSKDEVPAGDFALNLGNGMADDHINFAVANNGTLYCAVKTGYDNNFQEIILLRRNTEGTWDSLYPISPVGTRPIVLLNERAGKIRVIYTEKDGGGDILYKESSTKNIKFDKEHVLLKGDYNNVTSTKASFITQVVVMASGGNRDDLKAAGVLLNEKRHPAFLKAPELLSPKNGSTEVNVTPVLRWNLDEEADSYSILLSKDQNFSTTNFEKSGIQGNSITISNLSNNTTYFWKVKSNQRKEQSLWSEVYNFKTKPLDLKK